MPIPGTNGGAGHPADCGHIPQVLPVEAAQYLFGGFVRVRGTEFLHHGQREGAL